MYGRFPEARPGGLRRRSITRGATFWRLDDRPAEEWAWSGFPAPRHRFDPESGRFRVRYAGLSIAGAARERYLATGRYIPADHRAHHLVRLQARYPLTVLDLRTEANLDALGVDDRISTGREAAVWAAAHRLADSARRWWDDLDGLIYRSRTTPSTSVNLAFFSLDPFTAESRALVDAADVLTDLVLNHGFTLGWTMT